MSPSLLTPEEPSAFQIQRAEGRSPFVLLVDHASNRLPARLGTLGLDDEDRGRHIAWDIGIAQTGLALSARLDACIVLQEYSRLVIDANRPPSSPSSIVTVSERTRIPGNEALSGDERRQREAEVFWPYHRAIEGVLDARLKRGQPCVLVALHSFTPVYMDERRSEEIGVLYERDVRLAAPLLRLLRAEQNLCVGDNAPYSMSLSTDFTMATHGIGRQLMHVELELRQDLLASAPQCERWAERLDGWLHAALREASAFAH
jgi:predicted N-formylglutamate amidohydrolase